MTRPHARVQPFALPLRRPLATAHGMVRLRRGFLVELRDAQGRRGFGEATPLPEFGTEDLGACREALRRELSGGPQPLGGPASLAREPCARAAIETALFDLASRRSGQSLAAWIRRRAGLAGAPLASVAVQALVGGEDPAAVAESARAALAAGYRAFKLKLAVAPNRRDPGLDVDRIAALREVVGPSARLRLDANEAWGFDEAAAALVDFERFAIDFVEQPLRRDDLAGLKRLAAAVPIAIAADEALLGAGLERCLAARAAEVLVAKPAALGGVTASLELARRAREDGLRVVWSSLIDGAVGRAVPLALAAALAPEDEVHGLGTADWLAHDLRPEGASESSDADGRFALSSAAGLGFEPVLPAPLDDDATLRAHLESGFEVGA